MISFRHWKISTRLRFSFGLIVVLLASLAGISYVKLQILNDTIGVTVNDRYPKTVLLNDAKDALNQNSREIRNLVLGEDAARSRASLGAIEANTKAVSNRIETLRKTMHGIEAQRRLDLLNRAAARYIPIEQRFVVMAKEYRLEEAKNLVFNELTPAQDALFIALNQLREFQGDLMRASSVEADRQVAQTGMLVLALALGATFAAILLSVVTTRGIVRPLRHAVEVARSVASGDLTSDIRIDSSDETGQLMAALKAMNDSLAQIAGRVRGATDTISSVSVQIEKDNLDLSDRTERQASSLEETASAMEQLTSTVHQNANNARQANQFADAASQVAVKGNEMVGEVVSNMVGISESSNRIIDIISVIDSIAFQTNILALNAAVEAARAGEQGRGFAVVASEVRSLAQRSAAAAKEIKILITDSVAKIENGNVLVRQAGGILRDVVQSVKLVTDVVSEIAAASIEQSAGIHEINRAIIQMDAFTQQNATLVEQAAASAGMLRIQADDLAQAVDVFRTSTEDTGDASGIDPQASPVILNPIRSIDTLALQSMRT